jgi:hypothetical protein
MERVPHLSAADWREIRRRDRESLESTLERAHKAIVRSQELLRASKHICPCVINLEGDSRDSPDSN